MTNLQRAILQRFGRINSLTRRADIMDELTDEGQRLFRRCAFAAYTDVLDLEKELGLQLRLGVSG
jgi:hypothetical protein